MQPRSPDVQKPRRPGAQTTETQQASPEVSPSPASAVSMAAAAASMWCTAASGPTASKGPKRTRATWRVPPSLRQAQEPDAARGEARRVSWGGPWQKGACAPHNVVSNLSVPLPAPEHAAAHLPTTPRAARREHSSSTAALDWAHSSTRTVGLSTAGGRRRAAAGPVGSFSAAPALLPFALLLLLAFGELAARNADSMPRMADVLPVPGGPCTSTSCCRPRARAALLLPLPAAPPAACSPPLLPPALPAAPPAACPGDAALAGW